MVTIHSLLLVADGLVPVEEFAGPIADENYIEGAIELTVGYQPVLTRDMVDLIDQLWAYLIHGLEEVIAGRAFETNFPDMPVAIILRPQGRRVTIKVDTGDAVNEAIVAIDELRGAMVAAATVFFQRLRPLLGRSQGRFDRYLASVAALAAP